MKPISMAWRNVWRNGRRSGVTIAAMTLALWTMISYFGLMQGFMVGMERNVVDLEMGDVQVFNLEYQSKPSIYHTIENPHEVLAELEAEGYPAAARLLGSGLAAASETSAGVSLRGVDVARDRTVSKVYQRVEKGAWLDPSKPQEVVIGRRLARLLGAELGAEIVVLSQAVDGSMANELYTVRGILGGVSEKVDGSGVYMTDGAFRELFGMPEGAHQIIVRRPEHVPLEVAAERVRALAPRLDAQSWRELLPTLASMFQSAKGSIILMMVIVFTAIGIVVLNAMLMAVFERVREFGVLKAIGVSPGGVLLLIVLESAMQVGVAITIAVALSIPSSWYLATKGIDLSSFGEGSMMGMAWDPVWRMEVTSDAYVTPIIVLLIIVSLAVIYPALKAALIAPVEAMRSR